MSKLKSHKVHVVAAIIIQNNKFLIAKRNKGKHLAGYWEFPGGKVEPNETEIQACIREVKEELGCDIIIDSFFLSANHDYEDRSITLDLYIAHLADGQQVQCKEHEDLRFISSSEIDNYNFAPADLQFLPQIKTLMNSLKRYI